MEPVVPLIQHAEGEAITQTGRHTTRPQHVELVEFAENAVDANRTRIGAKPRQAFALFVAHQNVEEIATPIGESTIDLSDRCIFPTANRCTDQPVSLTRERWLDLLDPAPVTDRISGPVTATTAAHDASKEHVDRGFGVVLRPRSEPEVGANLPSVSFP